jgi:membrane protease YdiL (CAAX protease family)
MQKKFYPNRIKHFLILFIISLLLATPFVLMQNLLSLKISQILMFITFILSFIGLTYLFNIKRKVKLELNLKLKEKSQIGLMILIVVIFQILFAKPVNHLIKLLIGQNLILTNPIDTFLPTIGAVFLGPIFEEIIFRGIVLRGFLLTYTPKKAIIFSAIIFGVIHGNPFQIWGAIILGLFFGWIFYKTRSIGNTIILHFFANFIILLQSYLYFNFLDIHSVTILSIISVPVAIVVLSFLVRKLFREMNEKSLLIVEEQLQNK